MALKIKRIDNPEDNFSKPTTLAVIGAAYTYVYMKRAIRYKYDNMSGFFLIHLMIIIRKKKREAGYINKKNNIPMHNIIHKSIPTKYNKAKEYCMMKQMAKLRMKIYQIMLIQ